MIYSGVINPFQAKVMICLETKDRGRRMNGTKAVVREARKQNDVLFVSTDRIGSSGLQVQRLASTEESCLWPKRPSIQGRVSLVRSWSQFGITDAFHLRTED